MLIGLLAFAAGVGMLVAVFVTALKIFGTIDTLVPAASNSGPVKAEPGFASLGRSAIWIVLKFIGLLVLGWIGSMVAARGAHLAHGALAAQGRTCSDEQS